MLLYIATLIRNKKLNTIKNIPVLRIFPPCPIIHLSILFSGIYFLVARHKSA